MSLLTIKPPELWDELAFLQMTQASQHFHQPWVSPPLTSQEYRTFLERQQQLTHQSYLVFQNPNDLVGVFNLSEIVRGCFQSAYLGFYANVALAGIGLMRQGLALVLKEAFTKHLLHRIEANIQPLNQKSIALVKHAGFKQEGYSPRYLKINDVWCDHERWALTLEDWHS